MYTFHKCRAIIPSIAIVLLSVFDSKGALAVNEPISITGVETQNAIVSNQSASVRVSPVTGESMDYARPNTLDTYAHEEFKKVTGKTLVGSMLKPTPIIPINDFELSSGLQVPSFSSQAPQPASIRVYNKIGESVGFIIAKIQDMSNESHVIESIKKAQAKGRGNVIVGYGRTKHHYTEGERRSFIVTKASDGLAKAVESDASFTARRTALVSLPTSDFLESYKMSHCNVYSPEASLEIDRFGKYIYCRCKKNELDGRLICED